MNIESLKELLKEKRAHISAMSSLLKRYKGNIAKYWGDSEMLDCSVNDYNMFSIGYKTALDEIEKEVTKNEKS